MAIRNLIFDLGGVLYAIDNQRSYRAFRALVPAAVRPHYPAHPGEVAAHPIFREFEKGSVSPAEFREHFRRQYGITAMDEDIDAAWNALLIGVIPGRIADLRTLAERYRLVLLSNTNVIHVDHFREDVGELFACFPHRYLSFEMGMRKPDAEIFSYVLECEKIIAEETLFIDDTPENITGAAQLGIQTYHYDEMSGRRWGSLLSLI
ncbi:MAG: HAD family phosphatase [Bacteroidota bacterium]